MKKLFLLLPFFFSYSVQSQNSDLAQYEKEVLQLTVDVVYLASDYLEGRGTGTIGEKRAADYIVQRFKEIGVAPKGENGTWFQEFPWHEITNPHSPEKGKVEGKGKNVIGYIDNGAKTTVVIGGHYDHLGMGGRGSLYDGEPKIHNGADDNASGIAAMLRIAKHLKESKLKSNNYLFIAFSGEEKGLFGSKYFAANPTIPIEEINYMFNMDMVGMLNMTRVLAVQGTGTSPMWKKVLEGKNKQALEIKGTESGVGPSDHTSFYLKDIPVLHFFSGAHADYHKPSDDTHLVNFKGLQEIVDYSFGLITLLNNEGKLKFTKTKDESTVTPDFKVTLGIMPDYLFDGKGMRIDGVSEGRPAFKADMEAGDVVIKMGDLKVLDMMSYMKALGAFEPGQTIDVVIERNGKEIMKKVTF